MRRSGFVRTLALLGYATVSCTEFQHTNPFDPAYPLTITISGPDTLTSVNQVFDLDVTLEPEWPGATLVWRFDGEPPGPLTQFADLSLNGINRFRVREIGADENVAVTVIAGPHTATKYLALRQRMGRLEPIACQDFGLCLTFLENGTGVRTGFPRDSLGSLLPSGRPVPADLKDWIVSRNPAVATVASVAKNDVVLVITYNALSPGSTWLVFTKYAPDSLQVRVDYRPDTVRLTCPSNLRVGESAQLAAAVVGATGVDLVTPLTISWGIGFTAPYATVNSSGIVTGESPGQVEIVAQEGLTDKTGSCNITIDP